MTPLPLDDVWTDIGSKFKVYCGRTFDDVESVAGVYGWFYPLRIGTRNLKDFIEEVNAVYCYDAKLKGLPAKELSATFTWDSTKLNVERVLPDITISGRINGIWDRCVRQEALFDQLRRHVMRASIFMPPLYVGKAKNLNARCKQHIAGNDEHGFHDRYENFTRDLHISAKKVSDLVFACISTNEEESTRMEEESIQMEEVVEAIAIHACKPTYSVKV